MAELKLANSYYFDKQEKKEYLSGPYDDISNGVNPASEKSPIHVVTFGRGQSSSQTHGIGIALASVFILGEMCGGGVIGMPHALSQSGWYGIATIVLGALVSGYTGFQLGWCWIILQENWPEYREQTRKPYPEIGYRAGGLIMKYFCQFCVNFTVFGTAVAFLILGAQNIQLLVTNWFGWSLNYCWLLFVVSACLWPFTLFGTPKDFWPIAIGAISATTIAVILIIVGTAIDTNACYPSVKEPPTFVGFIQSYGTIAFAYGGHSAFPTVQHDMKQPKMFPKSVLMSYIVVLLLYFPMPVFGYLIYGSAVQNPIYYNISTEWVQDAVTILITGHVLFAYFIYLNPISQDLEEVIGIPKYFTWKRVCTRTFMVLLVLFFGLTIPDFNTLLNIIGGTTIAAMTFVCPGPLYLALRRQTQGNRREVQYDNSYDNASGTNKNSNTSRPWYSHISVYGSHIAWWEWLINGIVVIAGTFGGVATIYATIADWQSMAPPCYYSTVAMNGHIEGKSTNFSYCNTKS